MGDDARLTLTTYGHLIDELVGGSRLNHHEDPDVARQAASGRQWS